MKPLVESGGAFAKDVLFDSLNVVQAWEMLHDSNVVGNLNTEEYYDLCLAAGYSEEASQRAARDWGLKRLRKDLPV